MKDWYYFDTTTFDNSSEAAEAVGVRGRRIMELACLNIPVSPGFTLTSPALKQLPADRVYIWDALREPVGLMEKGFGKTFDGADNPLLVKVVESTMLNIVNTFPSIHNVGLCDATIGGFAKFVGEKFAYQEYAFLFRKMIELELRTELAKPRKTALEKFLGELEKGKTKTAISAAFKANRGAFPEEVYTSAYHQLMYIIDVFRSLFKVFPTNEDSALLIQTMVYGNFNKESCFGNFTTHDIINGENDIRGEYFTQAFNESEGEGYPIARIDAKFLGQLKAIGKKLEQQFKEIRRVRFTVENGRLWVIEQNPVPNKSIQAEIKTLLDLRRENVVTEEYIINAIKPGRLSELLHPTLDPKSVSKLPRISGGIAGAVGACIGRVYFSTDKLIRAFKQASQAEKDTDFILAMPSTFAEDVKAIELAKGVLAAEGGYASHAPVVARSLGKVALVLPDIKFGATSMVMNGIKVNEGDYITLNVPYYDPPSIYSGKGTLTKPTPQGSGLLEFLDIVQKHIKDFDVYANADQPKDAHMAKLFKAAGIGLCRTEHMFFEEQRILKFRQMIIATTREERIKLLDELKVFQADDFYQLFKIMDGLPVTIRLLDAPLHEFLPHTKEAMDEFLAYMLKKAKLSATEVRSRCDLLREVNPMLGHRGVRIAVSYPEIYHMQIEAIFEAAYRLKTEGKEVLPEIMIPIVMTSTEMRLIRNGKKIEGKSVPSIKDVEEKVRAHHKCDPIEYLVGSMIELPAAALQAGDIARYAEFFSFGTNDLTQTTNGLSRDDFNNFFSDYNEMDIIGPNPFKILGDQVKELIKIASERGRMARPDITLGLCGEHGGEPANIPFAKEVGMNYVSCSPYSIPIAKLAVAQMNLADKAAT